MSNLLKITGGRILSGEIYISGAKNSILPILAASILCDEEITIENVPDLSDVHDMLSMLDSMGSKNSFDKNLSRIVIFPKHGIKLDETKINPQTASRVRASSLFMGPLLARNKKYHMLTSGGCNIGQRAIDLHLKFLQLMGTQIENTPNQQILHTNNNRLQGSTEIDFSCRISVGATQNLIMAACLAQGTTTISHAAYEPEVVDLCNFLCKMGAIIDGIGSSILTIQGIDNLNSNKNINHKIIYDRIEAGSYIICALMNKGEVFIYNANQQHLKNFLETLEATSAEFEYYPEGILVKPTNKRPFAKSIVTAPYPYFPTDLQQIYATYACLCEGFIFIKENLFENRFNSSFELQEKMGAKIFTLPENKNEILIEGIPKFTIKHNENNPLICTDLRGGMSLLISALATKDENNRSSFIANSNYIKRGYENFLLKLEKIGAQIEII